MKYLLLADLVYNVRISSSHLHSKRPQVQWELHTVQWCVGILDMRGVLPSRHLQPLCLCCILVILGLVLATTQIWETPLSTYNTEMLGEWNWTRQSIRRFCLVGTRLMKDSSYSLILPHAYLTTICVHLDVAQIFIVRGPLSRVPSYLPGCLLYSRQSWRHVIGQVHAIKASDWLIHLHVIYVLKEP